MNLSFQKVFFIGASAGGVSAIHNLLETISPEIDSPIVVIQHLPDAKHVDVKTVYPAGPEREVVEAEDKMPVDRNHVYFAPGGYHLSVEKDGTFSLSQDDPIRYSRPSIDLTFESGARAFGHRVVGIILTGANGDGADGLRFVREFGGVCIVQDPAEAEFTEMPLAAIEKQRPDYVVKLSQLPGLMLKLQNEVGR